jgi:hypothetical protein
MRFTTELPETRAAITRPVAYDIVRQVGKVMHLPGITEILFAGPTDQAMQSGSSLLYEGAPSKFPGNSRISVDLAESYREDAVLAESSMQEEAPVIFLDKSLGLRLRPIYANAELTLTFNVRARSRVEAEKIRDEFHQRTSMGRQMLMHSVQYHYGIPEEIMTLIELIYQQRETVAGYGDTFEAWFKAHASDRLTQISALNGTSKQWVFAEHQVSVQGRFNFNVSPEAPDKAGDTGEYNYPFEYIVQYTKPVDMSIDYQLVNHSQLLPAKYHGPLYPSGTQPIPYLRPACSYANQSQVIWDRFNNNAKMRPQPMDGVRFPIFDDWLPVRLPTDTSTVFTTMILPDAVDLSDVLDLTQLVGVQFDGHVLEYMRSQATKLATLWEAMVHVELFKNQHWMGDEAIIVTPDLKVRSVEPLCQRDRYHLRISLLTDITKLLPTAFQAFRTQGVACQKILCALQDKMPYAFYVPKLIGPGIVPESELRDAAIRINKHRGAFATGLEQVMLTVANVLITTKRLDEYAPAQSSGPDPADPALSNDARYESILPDCPERCGSER